MTAPASSTATSTATSVTCRGLVFIYRLEGYDVVALGGVDLDIAPASPWRCSAPPARASPPCCRCSPG